MTYAELADILKSSSPSNLDHWIESYEQELADFFYQQNGSDFINNQFDIFYFQDFAACEALQSYQETKKLSDNFAYLLSLIGFAAEKMAEMGMDAVLINLVPFYPNGAGKFRLKALELFALVEDVRIDYIERFEKILNNLNSSWKYDYNTNTRLVVDVLVYFFEKGKNDLLRFGFADIFEQFKELFLNVNYKKKYPFLSHQILEDILCGHNPYALEIVGVAPRRLTPSARVYDVFSSINKEVFNHHGTDRSRDMFLGYDLDEVLNPILDRGKADFTVGYKSLDAQEKVLLYCYFNMKKHFFTSYAVFEKLQGSLMPFFKDQSYSPVFFDLGCGPMTSGLALGDLVCEILRRPIAIKYIGVDISDAMLARAKSIATCAVFEDSDSFEFVNNWNDISLGWLNSNISPKTPIIFNASYLFASSSLNEVDLATYIGKVANIFPNTYFVFQNPNRADRNVKYATFKKQLTHEILESNVEKVSYKAASKDSHEDVLYEILKVK